MRAHTLVCCALRFYLILTGKGMVGGNSYPSGPTTRLPGALGALTGALHRGIHRVLVIGEWGVFPLFSTIIIAEIFILVKCLTLVDLADSCHRYLYIASVVLFSLSYRPIAPKNRFLSNQLDNRCNGYLFWLT